MTPAAYQHLRLVDGGTRGGGEALEPVVADAHDGEPGGHGILPVASAFTAAAAMALPPLRPSRVT